MKKSVKYSVATSVASALVMGLLFKDSLIVSSSAAQEAKIVKLQAINKSSIPRTVQVVLDGSTLDLTVPPQAALLSEGEKVRMLGAVTASYTGKVRIWIQKDGKYPVVLKASKATIRYSQAWFPFNKKS